MLTYIDVSAVSEGISADFSFYLLAIANACSAVGRVVGGLAADRTGPLNVMTPATVIAGIMTYIWPFAATSIGGNIAVAIVYGYVPTVGVLATDVLTYPSQCIVWCVCLSARPAHRAHGQDP